MSQELLQHLADADARIAACATAGDPPGEAEALQRRAFALMGLGREPEARTSLNRAVGVLEASISVGNAHEAQLARAIYTRALLDERQAETQDAALADFHRVEAIATTLGDQPFALKAMHRVALVQTARLQLAEAYTTVQGMAQRLRALNNHHGLTDVNRHLASLSMALAMPNRAVAELDQALEHARLHGDPQKLLQTRIERRALQPISLTPAREQDDWQALIDQALIIDERGTAAQAQLQRAAELLRADRYLDGELAAEEARQSALATDQHVLYMMACLLIAEGRHFRDDRAGVIEILLTCRVTLKRTLGDEAAQGLTLVLDSLGERWGAEGLARARQQYRARMNQPPN